MVVAFHGLVLGLGEERFGSLGEGTVKKGRGNHLYSFFLISAMLMKVLQVMPISFLHLHRNHYPHEKREEGDSCNNPRDGPQFP